MKKSLNRSITVDGKTLLGGKSNGTIPPYSYETVRKPTIGFEKANITISANDAKRFYSAFMLGLFFLKVRPS